jgi:DNA replication protein DnaC
VRRIEGNDLSIHKNTASNGTATSEESGLCPTCGGAGFLRKEVPVGHPDFGRLIPCECRLREQEEKRREESRPLSNLEAFKRLTFRTFDSSVAGVKEAFNYAREFARDPHDWIVLRGGYGCGKTHLAAAIGNEALSRGQHVIFAVVPDLLDHLRSAYAPSSDIEYDELFQRIREAPLLILDDLGTENTTPWAEEKLYQIINYRYNNQMPTVITTNRDRLDGRIQSRISDRRLCREFLIDASDYRQRPNDRRLKDPGTRNTRGR